MSLLKVKKVYGTSYVEVKSILDAAEWRWRNVKGIENFDILGGMSMEAVKSKLRDPVNIRGSEWVHYSDALILINQFPLLYNSDVVLDLKDLTVRDDVEALIGFGDITFEAPNCSVEILPNGERGISSKYLEAMNKKMDGMNCTNTEPNSNSDVMKKIREWMDWYECLEKDKSFKKHFKNLYFYAREGEYLTTDNEEEKHIWMSQDLCLAIAATEHKIMQLQVISDLKRLRATVESHTGLEERLINLPNLLPESREHELLELPMIEKKAYVSLNYNTVWTIKRFWTTQNNSTDEEFDEKYPPKELCRDLIDKSQELGIKVLYTNSRCDDDDDTVTRLFHLKVFEECIPDMDLTECVKEVVV